MCHRRLRRWCHYVLLEVNSFWCSTYNRTLLTWVGGGHWPDAKTFKWWMNCSLLRHCSLRKLLFSNPCHTTFYFVSPDYAAEYAALSYTVFLSAWRPWWGGCRLLRRESPCGLLACALWDLLLSWSTVVTAASTCLGAPWQGCPQLWGAAPITLSPLLRTPVGGYWAHPYGDHANSNDELLLRVQALLRGHWELCS